MWLEFSIATWLKKLKIGVNSAGFLLVNKFFAYLSNCTFIYIFIYRNGKPRFRKPVMFKGVEQSLGGGGFRTPIKAYPRKC